VTYRYDALGRRIARVDGGAETRFVYDGWRVVEERDDQDNVLASYVHDGYIDDVVSMRRIEPIEGDWFFHSDDQFSVSLLTDFEGAPVERIGYDAWDATEGVYHYRLRTFDPAMGRFTTRDPIGIWGDPLNLGNGYTYTGNAPWSWLDPWGRRGLPARCGQAIKDWAGGIVDNSESTVGIYVSGIVVYGTANLVGDILTFGEGAADISVNHDRMTAWEITVETVEEAGRGLALIPPAAAVGRFVAAPLQATRATRAAKGATTAAKEASTSAVRVNVSRAKYPESAAHVEKARQAGHPSVLTLDRSGASQRRAQALRGVEKVPGKHLDEYPPAMFKEGGQGASVCPNSPADNMGSGATLGNALRGHEDGIKVIIEIIE
jgi:RHS repeat-associated protein